MHPLRKPTNEAAMCLEFNQIKSESNFAYCRFRGAEKGRQGLPPEGLLGKGRFGRAGAVKGAGREATGEIPAQPGLQLSHDVL